MQQLNDWLATEETSVAALDQTIATLEQGQATQVAFLELILEKLTAFAGGTMFLLPSTVTLAVILGQTESI